MNKRPYDFAGWVTKNDILCTDGVVIKHDAFQGSDQMKVPLVWNHDKTSPSNVLGHVMLQNEPEGVYGFGYFNDTDEAASAKSLVKHGDITAMSIGANRIKKQGNNVVHGRIYEVSLVMAGANPGALIETVMTHSDDDTIEAIIYTDHLIHSDEDVVEIKEGGDKAVDKTVEEILETFNDEQLEALNLIISGMESELKQSDYNYEEGDDLKHNVFNQGDEIIEHGEVLHSVFELAREKGSLQESILEHGITNIEALFPEATVVGEDPFIYKDQNTASDVIVNGVRKSPIARIKTRIADLSEKEARAKGYIKGTEKLDQVYGILTRQTHPTTIYKRQKLDRDDVIDVTDMELATFTNKELRMMLNEELARAILVGDGRELSDPHKISEEAIRPIAKDHDVFTVKKTAASPAAWVETVIKALATYQGTGMPKGFINPMLLADLRLMKDQNGRFLFGDIPSADSIATRVGLSELVPTTFLEAGETVIVNLQDYTLGASKGGQVTTFEDFDIDFNQLKFLIETRCSGALTVPLSAIYVKTSGSTGDGRVPKLDKSAFDKPVKEVTPIEPGE